MCDCAFHLIGFRYVRQDEVRTDSRRDLTSVYFLDIDDHHGRALLAHFLGDRVPDALGPARDDDDLSFHGVIHSPSVVTPVIDAGDGFG